MTAEDPPFLQFAPGGPNRAAVRALALPIANHYFQVERSRTQWRKYGRAPVRWEKCQKRRDGSHWFEPRESAPLHLSDFEKHLANGSFDAQTLALPDLICEWLDQQVTVEPGSHFSDASGTAVKIAVSPPFGPRFPLRPTLDREGVIFTSFHPLLITRVATLRNSLVQRSAKPAIDEWFRDFRAIVAEAVSLIDNTLHQLYFRAQYNCPPGWTFEPDRLGPRHGTSLLNKLKWVHRITGRDLDAKAEIKAFKVIKELRNHLQHFDPPCFACSWEEMATWLNQIQQVGWLAWKIRSCAQAAPSVKLAELLLQPSIQFAPRGPARRRSAQARNTGYSSTSGSAMERGAASASSLSTVVLSHLPPDRLAPGVPD